jgi:hypothetical protein
LVPYIPESLPEGSASNDLLEFFARLLNEHRQIEMIAETGFNTGVSSRAFLAARPVTKVVSFDIGRHVSVRRAKAAIDRRFPGRHELVLGNSTETLPAYAAKHPGKRFDLVFIDGGHDYEVAKADLVNFRSMSDHRTIVVMDDLTPWWRWGEGPTKVWQEANAAGWIAHSRFFRNGQHVTDQSGRPSDSIWAMGYYSTDVQDSGRDTQ